MIDEPGCRSGSASSASPALGPEPSHRTSLAILLRLTATVRRCAEVSTTLSWVACASKWLRASVNGNPVSVASSSATAAPNPAGAFRPDPTAVPPIGNSASLASPDSSRSMP